MVISLLLTVVLVAVSATGDEEQQRTERRISRLRNRPGFFEVEVSQPNNAERRPQGLLNGGGSSMTTTREFRFQDPERVLTSSKGSKSKEMSSKGSKSKEEKSPKGSKGEKSSKPSKGEKSSKPSKGEKSSKPSKPKPPAKTEKSTKTTRQVPDHVEMSMSMAFPIMSMSMDFPEMVLSMSMSM
ncbi:hypothetical protein IV203_010356 [Nitzschia inconspicua]|uniref:Uncharacterized protein n=1 Tax=Nitzschia inconspicua TaxID=303405 RepID=A0A9K3PLC0_9STRA|nr:hypothetical protein IV203_010356 [Nitzschia inconspicua]